MHHYAHPFLHALSIICYIGLCALVMAALLFLGWTQEECSGKYDPRACNEGDPYAGNDDDDKEIDHEVHITR